MKNFTLRFALLAATSLATLFGQPQPQDAPEEDGPGRGVARVSLMHGDVSVRRGDTNEWSAAAVNQPLMVEDRLLTGPGSRSEIQFDYSNLIRLGSDTEVRMGNLEQRRFLMMVSRGTVTYRILRDMEADVEIATPSIAVRPTKKGIYRIAVAADGTTEITVRSGEAEIFTPKGSQRLTSGRTLLARGDMNDPEFQFISAIPKDEWDQWNERRDKEMLSSRSYDYVSPDIYGAEDLDGNGRWVSTPDYGTVWAPRVEPGWAPYRNGRWVWADYYGWTWQSYDSWGWAPYHYGRWFNSPVIGWCWYPGGRTSHHYYRPALVAFFGLGSGGIGIGFGGGFGHVGWVPLAPHEPFYPWYGSRYYNGYRNGGSINNTHITNNINITNVYRNARVDGGVSSVQAGNFGRGSVRSERVNREDLTRAGLVRGQVQVAPDRASTRFSDNQSRVQSGSSRDDQRFYSRGQQGRIDRVPFEQQREQITRSSGGSSPVRTSPRNDGGFRGAVEGSNPATPAAPRDNGGRGTANTDNSGWRRAGEANNTPSNNGRTADPAASPRQNPSNGDGGWRRFGDPGSAPADRGNSGRSQTPAQPTDTGRGSWGRFGDPAAPANRQQPQSNPANEGMQRSNQQDRGSRTMESQPRQQQQQPQPQQQQPQVFERPQSRSNNDQGAGRMERRQAESPRMSQPVVTERAAPQQAPQRSETHSAPPRSESRSQPSAPPPSNNDNNSRGGGGRSESRSGNNKNR